MFDINLRVKHDTTRKEAAADLWHALLCLLDGHIENINLGDNFNFYMIQGLRPGSEHTITINPIFGDIEGPVTTTTVKTCNQSTCMSGYCFKNMGKTV